MGLKEHQDNKVVEMADQIEVGQSVRSGIIVDSHVSGDKKSWGATIGRIDLDEEPQISRN